MVIGAQKVEGREVALPRVLLVRKALDSGFHGRLEMEESKGRESISVVLGLGLLPASAQTSSLHGVHGIAEEFMRVFLGAKLEMFSYS